MYMRRAGEPCKSIDTSWPSIQPLMYGVLVNEVCMDGNILIEKKQIKGKNITC